MSEAEFTIVVAGGRRADVKRMIALIQENAEQVFEDETMQRGQAMTMLITKNKWINK